MTTKGGGRKGAGRAEAKQKAPTKRLPDKHPALAAAERFRREIAPHSLEPPEPERARHLAEHIDEIEKIRSRQTPEAREFRDELNAVIRFVDRVLSLAETGVRVAPEGTGKVFISPVRPDRGGEPLADHDDVTMTALLNERWNPRDVSFEACLCELSRLGAGARDALVQKFPALLPGRPREDLRRERVRLLSQHQSDAEIAVAEGMSRDDADRIAKDRLELIEEDRHKKK
jgi:hypothetical protein